MAGTAKKPIVILGASGDGLVIAQIVRHAAAAGAPLEFAGFLDDALIGSEVEGQPVFGGLEDWCNLDPNVCFVPALHKLKQMPARKRRVLGLGIPAERWATIVHPTACVADKISIGLGSSIAAHVVVQPGALIGRFATIRSGANIGHDAECGDFSYVGPNATLCGRARIEEGGHVGPNAVLVDGVIAEAFSVIGAGTVATKRVPSYEVHFGVPARVVGRIRS